MSKFNRSLDVDVLTEWDVSHPGNAVGALFSRWCLPGQPRTPSRMLRIGIRDRYLNLYVMGQSIAKLSVQSGGPVIEVHEAYVKGRRRERGTNVEPLAQSYVRYGPEELAKPEIAARIPDWIATAETHASAEKRFVDDLITANPGIIDLEMGLPASNQPDGDRVAPRMDVVVAQTAGQPSIAFWEAKCAVNSGLRKAAGEPDVMAQLRTYADWMSQDVRKAEVQQAYQTTASLLLKLHRAFPQEDGEPSACVGIWQSVANADALTVILQPGLVIGNSWPEGYPDAIASGRMAQAAMSFEKNGHGEKLRSAGVHVHEVGPEHQKPTLPVLSNAVLPG